MNPHGKRERLAILGAGNMAEAFVQGLAGTAFPANRIRVTDIRPARLEEMSRRYGVEVSDSNREAAVWADALLLAVKPQNLATVLSELSGIDFSNLLVVSIAAGVQTSWIEERLEGPAHVVRAMPNMPALVRSGVAALCGGTRADAEDLQEVETWLRSLGTVVRVTEDQMDAVTALSGSGPAYVCLLMEALASVAREIGLSDEVARELILATVHGTGTLLRETGLDAADVRRRVASKGGTTEAALAILEGQQFSEVVRRAVHAAYSRSRELSRGPG
ncbi:MAG: pyrroline-5-carboxylate reductase [Kiritimatiellia bacterium]|nr:pyrroline-5-carboxylate reductase [Kiritimatiellia bacterium]